MSSVGKSSRESPFFSRSVGRDVSQYHSSAWSPLLEYRAVSFSSICRRVSRTSTSGSAKKSYAALSSVPLISNPPLALLVHAPYSSEQSSPRYLYPETGLVSQTHVRGPLSLVASHVPRSLQFLGQSNFVALSSNVAASPPPE